MSETPLLDHVASPADLRALPASSLKPLAGELRAETLRVVSRSGGHLGASLGVIELTLALHYVFDTPRDCLIWDVGHQSYPHKILTGRRGRMASLRQGGGISGFTKRSESPYDAFGAAHTSTSISAALGFAVARDLKGEAGHVIAVIGDGAMSAGMAFEALNNAGALGRRLIIVLNDNGMSIAPAVGALSNYLTRQLDTDAAERGETIFEKLGLRYVGPLDGHDLDQLLPALLALRDAPTGPVLLHVRTEKGFGFAPAAASVDRCHGVNRFDLETGVQEKPVAAAPTYTKVFGETLVRLAAEDGRIIAITAAMPAGTGTDLFAKRFPERFFDVGIAEQHAVTFAAGLACEGMRPFCAIYSTFLQRAYDQIMHDVALQKLPVRFALDRAGLVGADGATHAGAFDVAYLACLPNMVLMAPGDEADLVRMLATAAAYDEGPIALRYPRAEGLGLPLPERCSPLEIGRGRLLAEGNRIAVLSYGARLGECIIAAEKLKAMGLDITLADARFAKPLDQALIDDLAAHHEALVLVEDGACGGFNAAVMAHLVQAGWLERGLKLRALNLPDRFQDQDSQAKLYADAGLDSAAILRIVLALDTQDAARRKRRFGASGLVFLADASARALLRKRNGAQQPELRS